MTVAVLMALCRYGAALMPMLIFGACLMRAVGRLPYPAAAAAWQRRAATVGLLCAAALLPLQAATIAGEPAAMVQPALLWQVATLTGYGQAWMAKAVLAVLLVGAAWRGAGNTALLWLAGGVLAATGASGHAAMHGGTIGLLHVSNNIVHILCAAFWLGALAVVLPLLHRWPRDQAEAGRALARFSSAGHWAVAGVMATGALNTWLILRDAGLNLQSPYQWLLALKAGLALLMAALALANRYYWVPRLARGGQAMRVLRRQAAMVLCAGLAAVLLVSLLGMLSPA
ncbi:copper homeostasis membrane protein CopD [Bordetella genomosp. 1]|nr:copper homeostasis membrane protein CopD [Bordetella genomosp. 1]